MGWSGKWTTTHPLRYVRTGDYAIPAEVTAELEGDKGDPDLSVRFRVVEGRPQCVEVRAAAKDGGRAVRTSDLHSLSLDAMTVSVFARTAVHSRYDPETNVTTSTPIQDEREFWRAVNAADAAVKAPRRGTTQAELEQVAELYREHVGDRPIESIRTLMGYGSERTAARRVEQARATGLLPSTTPGKKKA